MSNPSDTNAPDRCARCGYDLRGVDDDQPCPECGLLAERSRHAGKHLVDATPRWLLGIAAGVTLILVALCVTFGWIVGQDAVRRALNPSLITVPGPGGRGTTWVVGPQPTVLGVPLSFEYFRLPVFDLAAVLLLTGVLLLTRREPGGTRRADDVLRYAMRMASTTPLVALGLIHYATHGPNVFRGGVEWAIYATMGLLTVGCMPLPALLFAYLRRLAQRVLHPRLAEHAAIVGVGLSLTLLFVAGSIVAISIAQRDDSNWMTRSNVPIVLLLTDGVALLLFGGWSVLNCVRFAISFFRAYRAAQRRWASADRSSPGALDVGRSDRQVT